MNAREREIGALSARVQADALRLCGKLPGPAPRLHGSLLVPLGVSLALAAWLALNPTARNRALLSLGLRVALAPFGIRPCRREYSPS